MSAQERRVARIRRQATRGTHGGVIAADDVLWLVDELTAAQDSARTCHAAVAEHYEARGSSNGPNSRRLWIRTGVMDEDETTEAL